MFTIYGKPDCSQCTEAKMLLDMNEVVYEYLQVGVDITKQELVSIMEVFGVLPRSVPQIVQDGKYVGGLKELKILLDTQN